MNGAPNLRLSASRTEAEPGSRVGSGCAAPSGHTTMSSLLSPVDSDSGILSVSVIWVSSTAPSGALSK